MIRLKYTDSVALTAAAKRAAARERGRMYSLQHSTVYKLRRPKDTPVQNDRKRDSGDPVDQDGEEDGAERV
jgi:hypothetical protein